MITRLIKRIYRIVPAGVPSALVVGTILYLTLFPRPLGDDDIELFEGADKVVHAIMFGAMAFAITLDRFMARHDVDKRAMTIITLITIATGIAIEFLQGIMELGRSAEAADALADSIGAIIGIILFSRVKKKIQLY